MLVNLILDKHIQLLKLIALALSTKSRSDGWWDGMVNVRHGNIVEKMKTRGWPPIVNLAKELYENGLIEIDDITEVRLVSLTDEGRKLLSNGEGKVRHQVQPPLDVSNLHSEVQSLAALLVKDGHYRQAIIDTFIGLDRYVKVKSGINENGSALMQKAFSQNKPVMELSKNSEEQLGFMMLFTGAVKAVRNQYAHNIISPVDHNETLEWLAFASTLFRLVDRAVLLEDR